jgi:hypothetical protein
MKPSPFMSYNWKAPAASMACVRATDPTRQFSLTFQFLIQSTSARHAEGADELLEVDCPVFVLVKHVEHIL